MTPTKGRKSDDQGKPATGQACPSCGATTPSKARFCQACGASLEAGAGGGKWSAGRWTTLGAVAGLAALAVFAVVSFSEQDEAPPSSSAPPMPNFNTPPVASSGQPPDLSRMTPREAADRLFNRIMMASEQGNRPEALRFAPMAIQAYGNLPTLDRDAHYHLGLIHGVAGDRAKVGEQIAALRRGSPNHLLALLLEHNAAERSGDRTEAARVVTTFAAAYDAEIATGRPEYAAHRKTIERFHAAALPAKPSAVAPVGAPPVGAAPAGAALEGAISFAKNCATCHGSRAAGSGKGPPLVHKIYEPGHHGDASFYRAVSQGVVAHHWSFGPMPPIAGVTEQEVARIIAYVRELQRAAGIR